MTDRPPHGTGIFLGAVAGVVFWAIVAVIVWASSATPATYIISKNDRGGYVKPAFIAMLEKNKAGHRVEIRNRTCLSACTIHLGTDNLCISADTGFGFHKAGGSRDKNSIARAHAMITSALNHHSTELGSMFFNVWSKSRTMHRETGAELNRDYGVPLCN